MINNKDYKRIVRGDALYADKPQNELNEYLVTLQLRLEESSASSAAELLDTIIRRDTLFVDYVITAELINNKVVTT